QLTQHQDTVPSSRDTVPRSTTCPRNAVTNAQPTKPAEPNSPRLAEAGNVPDVARLLKNSDAATAIPSADPTRCDVCNTAAAEPACPVGTCANVNVWFGPITTPLPSPASSSGPRMTNHTTLSLWYRISRAVAARPSVTDNRPSTIMARPKRCTTRPPSAELNAEPRANGSVAAPAANAEYPRPCWKYTVSTRKIPVNPAK